MNQRRLSVQNGSWEKRRRLPFNVVIVYDARDAALRAMEIFHGLVEHFGDEFEFHCDLWCFDVLEFREGYEAALLAGPAAQLLIISSCDTQPPKTVKDWLEQSAAAKAPGSAALVGLLKSHQGSKKSQRKLSQLLRRTADRSRLDLFLHQIHVLQLLPAQHSPADEQATAA